MLMDNSSLHIIGLLSGFLNVVAVFAATMVRGRLKDKDKEIARLVARIDELEERDDRAHSHETDRPPSGAGPVHPRRKSRNP